MSIDRRPELGFDVRMRIMFAVLAGMCGLSSFVTIARGDLTGGIILGTIAGLFMFGATTNRWRY